MHRLYDSLDPGTRLFVDRLVDAAGPLAFGHDTDVMARYEEAMEEALAALRDFFRVAQMERDEEGLAGFQRERGERL